MLLLAVVFIALFSLGSVVVSAQDESEETLPITEDVGFTTDVALIKQYTEATKRCDSPSLECLVYYVVNYTAIEITNSIAPIAGVEDPNDSAAPINQLPNSEYRGPVIAGRKGVVPGLSYLIVQMYGNPPATTDMYVADVLNSAGVAVAPPAYAQGLGFVALNPVLELWKTFRNVAYIFYVLMFVVIGFMIMLRQKVGQHAITAQQAIPSIIVSLIFVTFSYAIAGFLIDLMYLSMFLIVGIFESVTEIGSEVIGYNIFQLGKEFINQGYFSGKDAAYNMVPEMIQAALNSGNFVGQSAVSWVSGITVGLIVAVAVLIATFKLFFELLKSYATIVLMVVTAPIQLMIGAIPGKNTVSSWIKSLVGNLSAFPVVLMGFIMFRIFVDGAMGTQSGGFMPPFLLSNGTANSITALMGLAILLAIPEIVKKVKDSLGAGGGFGEMIAQEAMGKTKQALPLGGRLGTGVWMGPGGAIISGGAAGLSRGGSQAAQVIRNVWSGQSRPSALLSTVPRFLGGFGSGALLGDSFGSTQRDAQGREIRRGGVIRGFRTGINLGARATNRVATSAGANQPDWLSPVTNLYDRAALTEEQRAEIRENQRWEDRMDRTGWIRRRSRGEV